MSYQGVRLGAPTPVFRGSDAVSAGRLTRGQLRGPKVQRLFQGVYVFTGEPVTHQLRCAGAALALPPDTVITGRSAAVLWGVQLARAQDPVEIVVPDATRIARRAGLDVRRSVIRPDESTPWSTVAVATPLRTTLDLLFDRPLPDAVADLDAVLRAGLVTLPAVTAMVQQRSDKGIVAARHAVELADPRAESHPESQVRVWLALDGLHPSRSTGSRTPEVGWPASTLPSRSRRLPWSTTVPGATDNCGHSTATATASTESKPKAGRSSS